MSYNQKPPGTGGAGPPNGPNNSQQVAKTLAGFQQQMQNFVHGQNPLPQSSQADLNAFLQQQRLQNMLKHQQQQFLQQHFQQQMQQQQQQHQHQQQQQQQNKDRVGSEPLALTRTPAAAELLNKTYQQHHQQHPNGSPAPPNPTTLNQFQQQMPVLTPNLMQQIQAFQLQMQQHQQQQQQQQQHHSQSQQAQHHTPSSGSLQSLPQQQLHNQSAQQQKSALSTAATAAAAVAAAQQLQQRYLSAAVSAQASNANKVIGAAQQPPPPLTTNQIKPPNLPQNLPPSTQITPVPVPVPGNSGVSQSSIIKPSTATNPNITAAPTKQVSPSISLLPPKPPNSAPSAPLAAHQHNKFNTNKNSSTPTTNVAATTPTPAHVQKPTTTATTTTGPASATTTATVAVTVTTATTTNSATVPSGNVISTTALSSSSSSTPNVENVKSNLNSEISISSTLTTSSTVALTATTTATTTTATATSVQKSLQKNILPPSTKSTAATVHLPLNTDTAAKSAPKSGESVTNQVLSNPPTVQSPSNKIAAPTVPLAPIKPAESRTEVAAAIKKPTTTSQSSMSSPKSEAVATTTKAEAITQEKQSKNGTQSPASQSTSAASEEDNKNTAVDVEKLKNETAPIKANNNNALEKKEIIIEKEDVASSAVVVAASASASHMKVSDNLKKNIKESTEEKLKTDANKNTEKASVESNEQKEKIDENNQNVAATKSTQPQDRKLPKAAATKTNEEHCANAALEKKSENKTIAESSGDAEKTSKPKLDKEKKIAKVDNAVKITANIASTAAAATPSSKVPKDKEAAVSSENVSSKKPNRQAKGSKTAASATPIGNVSETPDHIVEKTIVASSSRATREEKRKTQKTPIETASPLTPIASRDANSSANSDRKSQRHRLKTILYQSPLPELAYITKLSASEASNSPKPMSGEDKLIVFYKNEYMAVRNAEGTFYLCQTMQNVYRTSPRISIRWLSEDAKDSSVYIPDFYDHTDIECVLTTVDLKRIDKGHLRLPNTEKVRIENILKKAIDVEKGIVPRPELTEENPDGLDISLYKDESQIEKKLTGTPVSSGRSSKRSLNNSNIASKSVTKATPPSKAAVNNNKRKAATLSGGSASKKSKSPTKKRKLITKRKAKRGTTSDEDNETSEDHASDAEYKPNQKKSNPISATKTSLRVQRLPLIKAKVSSPEPTLAPSSPSSSRNKSVTAKISATTPTPSRSERATKRKAGTDIPIESSVAPIKRAAVSNANTNDVVAAESQAKPGNTKSKDNLENVATSSKKIAADIGNTSSSNSNISVNTENGNSTANGSSAAVIASRPTRSRK